MSFTPRSVEGYRAVYGRTPTVAEFRAMIAIASPPASPKPTTNGCDCYDPECTWCCDEEGNAR